MAAAAKAAKMNSDKLMRKLADAITEIFQSNERTRGMVVTHIYLDTGVLKAQFTMPAIEARFERVDNRRRDDETTI
jgi:hypothetical protein